MFTVFPPRCIGTREIIGKSGAPPQVEIPALSRNCEVMYNVKCIIDNKLNSTFLILNYTLVKPGDLPQTKFNQPSRESRKRDKEVSLTIVLNSSIVYFQLLTREVTYMTFL